MMKEVIAAATNLQRWQEVNQDYLHVSFVVTEDLRTKLTRHFTKDIPDMSLYEIRMAKEQQRAIEDGITLELR